MQNYIPVHCSKCRAMNNSAQSRICRHCGSSLAMDNFSSGAVSKKLPVKSVLMSLLSVMIAVSGWMYSSNRNSASTSPPQYSSVAPSSTSAEKIKLPPDSWHNKSWRSYLTNFPSAKEILEKNAEAGGREIPAETIKSTGAAGKILVAPGACYTQKCLDDRREDERKRNIFKPEINLKDVNADKYLIYFQPLGAIEIYAKKPDKFLRIFKKPTPYTDHETEDTITGFDGRKGWQKTRIVTSNGVSFVDKNISEMEISELKESMTNAWNMNKYIRPEAEVSELAKINGNVAFVLTQNGDASTPGKLYFDAVSGYLIKIDMAGSSIYFDDYKDYEGTKMPYTILYRRMEPEGFYSWVKMEISEWNINKVYEDSMFEK